MKEGWTYKKLGEVCNIDFGTRVVRSRDAGSKYPVYGGGGATFKMDTYNREDCMVISRFGMSEECTRFVKGKFFLNDSGLTLSMKTSCMIQTFLDWQIHSLNNTIYSLGRGAAQKNLDTKALAEIKITYPNNKEEQQRIVSRLDSAFAHIDERKANAEKQLSEARALFQKSLAKAMEPKEGWEERNLDDVAAIFSGYAFKSSVFQKEGKYQVLRIGNIKQNNLRLSDNAVFIDDLDSGVLNKSLLKEGDLVVTQTGTRHKRDYGFVAMVEKDNLLLNQRNACVRFRNKLSAQFFLYYSYTDLYKDSFFANEGGTVGQGNVGLSALKEMKYYTPPLAEQQRIVVRLDALSENIRKYEEIQRQIISECDALKQALLRKVFE